MERVITRIISCPGVIMRTRDVKMNNHQVTSIMGKLL
jgi:hypothetical protein